ncbi:hypothetical protein [Virgibacillus sp. SK37]|uniref:hypothetical protein n=1 Tax=Virgibacillus sp. SK37 TaxID=403957 RepID=UPI0004D0CE01|nr:hypothetical protein [Virgibacillus sp. SK37]AIF45562.1 hypothetical protein X953_16360 [Virgibacillus sp. SK37]
MDNGELTPVPINNIQMITKSEFHLPSKNSLRELKTLTPISSILIYLYKWNGELFYVTDFHEIALQKKYNSNAVVNAQIISPDSRDDIVHLTLRNSITNKVGIQKLNQFRFDLVNQLENADLQSIQDRTGFTMKQILQFSFHEEMTKRGKLYAEKARDLTMMNKIRSSSILCKKAPHIRKHLEFMRIDGSLTSFQLYFIEKYARSVTMPFHKKKNVYEEQIYLLLSQKEPREQRLFNEVEYWGMVGRPPSAA